MEATKTLVKILYEKGQRALVGKVNMDQNSPDNYKETFEASVRDTRAFVDFALAEVEHQKQTSRHVAPVLPVITPRFVPTCSSELLEELGNIAKEHHLHIQSHISENKEEVSWVKMLHPDNESYTDVYIQHGLLTNKTIMGHGVYLSGTELKQFAKHGAGVSHCPVSNFALRSGCFNVRRALEKGVKVGLGTDVSGGYSPSMLEVMRQAVIASTATFFHDDTCHPLSFKEVFYLATQGSAELLAMGDTIGTIVPGKSFDACIVDPSCEDSPFNNYDFVAGDIIDIFQKFIFLGNAHNIRQVYVQGKSRISK